MRTIRKRTIACALAMAATLSLAPLRADHPGRLNQGRDAVR